MHFEWQHIDEVILYYCRPSKAQLYYELSKIWIPFVIIMGLWIVLYLKGIIAIGVMSLLSVILTWLFVFSVFYKIYRARNNYLYITSKRILFHGIEWFFHDYVKKIHYENVRNINYYTESIFWKIFGFWAFEVQTSHGRRGNIRVYHVHHWKMLSHYIDKLISLSPDERKKFGEFDVDYFKK